METTFWAYQRRIMETTTSVEWRGVWSLMGRWHDLGYSRETIERTASKLARRYHVSGNIYSKPVPDGLTYDECRQRYAAWKDAAWLAWQPHWEW